MSDFLAPYQDVLQRLCERHHVRTLELFGSATTGRFNQDSDIDFLVDFRPLSPAEHSAAYFSLLESLQDVFQRNVDLVELPAVKNPFFLRSVNDSRTVVYAT